MKQLLTILALLTLASAQAQVTVKDLRCETMVNPSGIDVPRPRLSWKLESKDRGCLQTLYEIMVSGSKEKLDRNQGDLWQSNTIASRQNHLVTYNGKALRSGSLVYWKVRVGTNRGNTGWSAPASFSMGLLRTSDWKGKWIGLDEPAPWDSVTQWSRLSARYLRKRFQTEKTVRRATAYICGLGLYELYLNGSRIGDQVLAPAPTDYRKSVLYNSYDVTGALRKGANAIGVVLGNGRYFTMRQNYKPKKINTFGYPRLLVQLEIEYADGSRKTIISDGSWKLQTDGPIRSNNEYDGEEYDARKDLGNWSTANYNDASWQPALLVPPPPGKLKAQMQPLMRVMQDISPRSITRKTNGNYIVDMGQNFSGWLRISTSGAAGTTIKLKYAESLDATGSIYVANLRDARSTDTYILRGGGTEIWEPRFVYHGFRFVEIIGWPGEVKTGDLTGRFVYDDLANSGSFQSSDSVINTIHRNAWWGIASNYKGMPVDCPQRNERQPWLGDRATGAGGEAFLFDNYPLYKKWLHDIRESQTREGAIPDVAPAFWNYYSDNMTWPGTYLLVADRLYRHYGDSGLITAHYASMKKWMTYMKKYVKDGLMTRDKYGDWCVPPESRELIKSRDSLRTTDGTLIASAYYFHFLGIMKQFAVISGKLEDTAGYSALRHSVLNAFNERFFSRAKHAYANNSITANLLPLHFGMVPALERAAVFNNIYNKIKIENHMHISTGVVGTQWLMRMLTENDRADIAYTLASNKTYPSWGYMAENGATTIWELWNGNTANPQMNSQNHVMLLGDLLIWLYEDLAGIKSVKPGFTRLNIKPAVIDGLRFINATYRSPQGIISSSWKRDETRRTFSWKLSIPANTTALVHIPANSREEVTKPDGAVFIRLEDGYAVFEVGSGDYEFESVQNFKKGIVADQFIFERPDFPESHAATIAETPEGLIASWFGGTKEGNKDVCIWTSFLRNNQWTAPVKVADGIVNDTTRFPCYNPVLYQVPGGELLLFYKIGPNVAGWKGYLIRSNDHGKTWSARESLPDGFLGPIKNKPVLIGKTLICPSSTEKSGWKVHLEFTSDNGRTWTRTEPLNDGKTITAIQPSLLTYADGRMQLLCRSKNRTLNETWSSDGGKTWGAMKPSPLPNNNSGTDAVTLRDGTQLLVYNHVKPDTSLPNGKGARTPLNVAISKDGVKWFAALVLEDSPVSQYSYPSVIQTSDGLVHIVYTWRRERVKHVVIDPSKLELKEIINEQWPGGTRSTSQASEE